MIIHIIFLFTMLLVIWFNTEAFVEYSYVLKLKWFKVNEISKVKKCTYLSILEVISTYFEAK